MGNREIRESQNLEDKMAGRKPKPTQLKIIQGNPGKRALNKDEPQPERRLMRAPSFLSVEGKKEWKYMAAKLHKLGLLTEIDRAALAAYCQWFGRWVEAERILNEKGPLYKTEKGTIQQSPMIFVAHKAAEQMYRYIVEFGMTPSSRSRVQVAKKEAPKDEAAEFFSNASC